MRAEVLVDGPDHLAVAIRQLGVSSSSAAAGVQGGDLEGVLVDPHRVRVPVAVVPDQVVGRQGLVPPAAAAGAEAGQGAAPGFEIEIT